MFWHFLKPVNKFRQTYLPGVITGSADDDPSTVSTYSIGAAQTGFSQLWLVVLAAPLLIAIHRLSAKIGEVTRQGLITLIKNNFGRPAGLVCLIVFVAANILTLVADIVGMAAGFQLLTGENYLYFIVPLILIIAFEH